VTRNSEASGGGGLEVNIEGTKCMTISCHQNVGQNHSLLTAIKSSENVAQFKYLGTTVNY
jgi:hypothetical protein